jgi:hypothetical protein
MLRLPFTGDEAAESRNFETLYFAAVTTALWNWQN